MAHTPKLLVVTDLDGTLLDHHDYDFSAAQPALARLQRLGIPVILNTSKTAAELAPLRERLGNQAPYVVENGAALVWPEGEVAPEPQVELGAIMGQRMQPFGATRAAILAALAEIQRDTGLALEGFADWDVDTLVAHTGLDPDSAGQALQRHFSEPLLWQGSDDDYRQLQRALRGYGLRLLRGGRFVHVIGQSDKGRCLEPLRRAYGRLWGRTPLLIALGDGDNDVAMLEAADHPVVVRSPVNASPALNAAAQRRAIHTEPCGPAGWNDAIMRLLDHYQLP
ncbi:mannosyl-3-phosphoglycerate phosphatase family [Ferrimonas balearica DSM 9799]|uniref:Mannosyl-3-phosphoglycerate phosphatase family n=1 Tax=Ferrimonas balearica (strain DSM 9799 / CCM 4581 / KCTC 23876 / PAT) TaxID=550540 RepID=E1SV59_FERBD|nr:HAD-IIB family hydrolase [Ferrimonas balearica]ADN77359.1 mannosyl-3-phosphoglycerate phosphatase family [Ferrimonas balearica DSM 9799]